MTEQSSKKLKRQSAQEKRKSMKTIFASVFSAKMFPKKYVRKACEVCKVFLNNPRSRTRREALTHGCPIRWLLMRITMNLRDERHR